MSKLKGYAGNSHTNERFAQFLTDNNIKYKREFKLENYRYDFKVNNILIEIDPLYTHNSLNNHYKKHGVPQAYHRKKTITALNNGYKCIHVFDWIEWDYVLYLLKNEFILENINSTMVWYNKDKKEVIYDTEEIDKQKMIKENYLPVFTDGFEIKIIEE